MGKVVFNIVETDYDVSKDEEKYQKFRKSEEKPTIQKFRKMIGCY